MTILITRAHSACKQLFALPVLGVVLLALTQPAQATTYNVSQVLNFGDGPSHVHTTTGRFNNGTAETSRVADIESVTGTYTLDEAGVGSLSLQLTTTSADVFGLYGDGFSFGYNAEYDGHPLADHVLLNPVNATLALGEDGLQATNSEYSNAPGGNYNVNFLATLMNGTNTLVPSGEGVSTFILSLWGAGKHDSLAQRRAGLDIRVEFTPAVVPVPAAFLLFVTALAGLMGFRQSTTRTA